jgi:hypothetical protein
VTVFHSFVLHCGAEVLMEEVGAPSGCRRSWWKRGLCWIWRSADRPVWFDRELGAEDMHDLSAFLNGAVHEW